MKSTDKTVNEKYPKKTANEKYPKKVRLSMESTLSSYDCQWKVPKVGKTVNEKYPKKVRLSMKCTQRR